MGLQTHGGQHDHFQSTLSSESPLAKIFWGIGGPEGRLKTSKFRDVISSMASHVSGRAVGAGACYGPKPFYGQVRSIIRFISVLWIFRCGFLIADFDSENAVRQEADCELNWNVWIWIIGRVQSRKRDSGFTGRRAPRSMYDKFSVFHFP